MEKNKKELKTFSLLILLFVALSLIKNIVSLCVNGIAVPSEIPQGMSKEMVQTIATITVAISFIIYIPQIYVGVKGIKVAEGKASGGRAHITWALILAILAGIALISAFSELIKVFNFDAILNLVDPALDLIVFAFYYVYARKVAC